MAWAPETRIRLVSPPESSRGMGYLSSKCAGSLSSSPDLLSVSSYFPTFL